MVLNTTFNNISVISWRSVLLVEYPEKTTDLPQNTDPLSNFAFLHFDKKLRAIQYIFKDERSRTRFPFLLLFHYGLQFE